MMHEYKVEDIRSESGDIGEMNYVIPAIKMLEVQINRLAKSGWRIIMMDVVTTDLIVAVYERLIEIEIEITEVGNG